MTYLFLLYSSHAHLYVSHPCIYTGIMPPIFASILTLSASSPPMISCIHFIAFCGVWTSLDLCVLASLICHIGVPSISSITPGLTACHYYRIYVQSVSPGLLAVPCRPFFNCTLLLSVFLAPIFRCFLRYYVVSASLACCHRRRRRRRRVY